MKNAVFSLFVAMGIALPATAGEIAVSDSITASFERDMNRTPVQGIRHSGSVDQVQNRINLALRGQTDQVVASFDRDLYRTPVQGASVAGLNRDLVQERINLALRGETDPVVASFDRDLYHMPVQGIRHSGSVDQVQNRINLALRGETAPVMASFERDLEMKLASASDSDRITPWGTPGPVTAIV